MPWPPRPRDLPGSRWAVLDPAVVLDDGVNPSMGTTMTTSIFI